MKSKFELVISIAIILFIATTFLIDIDNYIPGLSKIVPITWMFLLLFDIYEANKYLKNKPKNEIRIRSKNDDYYQIVPFIFGSIFCLVSIIMLFLPNNKITAILTFIAGIILIFKGMLFIPSALLKIENGNLYLNNGRINETIIGKNIEEVILNTDNIVFKLKVDKIFIFSQLELNENEIIITKSFLTEKLHVIVT